MSHRCCCMCIAASKKRVADQAHHTMETSPSAAPAEAEAETNGQQETIGQRWVEASREASSTAVMRNRARRAQRTNSASQVGDNGHGCEPQDGQEAVAQHREGSREVDGVRWRRHEIQHQVHGCYAETAEAVNVAKVNFAGEEQQESEHNAEDDGPSHVSISHDVRLDPTHWVQNGGNLCGNMLEVNAELMQHWRIVNGVFFVRFDWYVRSMP